MLFRTGIYYNNFFKNIGGFFVFGDITGVILSMIFVVILVISK